MDRITDLDPRFLEMLDAAATAAPWYPVIEGSVVNVVTSDPNKGAVACFGDVDATDPDDPNGTNATLACAVRNHLSKIVEELQAYRALKARMKPYLEACQRSYNDSTRGIAVDRLKMADRDFVAAFEDSIK